MEAIDEAICTAHSWPDKLGDWSSNLSYALLLSISLLGNALRCVRLHIVPDGSSYSSLNSSFPFPPKIKAIDPRHQRMARYGKIDSLTAKLIDKGWTCPAALEKLLRRSLEARLRMLQWPALNDGKSHSLCVDFECKAHNTDADNYKQQHVQKYYSCPMLQVDSDEIDHMALAGELILCHPDVSDDLTDTSNIRLTKGSENTAYIAISHVWSDGLGNPHANAIHRCQLSRISKLVRSLNQEEPIAFWIDTICCPQSLGPKQAVILRMREIYEKADNVLILDSLIISATFAVSITDAFLLLYMSGWFTRLWTLQEGVLAKDLWLQLGGQRLRALHVSDLISLAGERPRCLSSELLYLDDVLNIHGKSCVEVREDEWGQRLKEAQNVYPDLRSLYQALKGRAMTVDTDEPLCLGNLLDLPSKTFLGIPPQDRMQQLWKALTEIPLTYCLAKNLA